MDATPITVPLPSFLAGRHPDYYEAYLRHEYASLHAAAVAAGVPPTEIEFNDRGRAFVHRPHSVDESTPNHAPHVISFD